MLKTGSPLPSAVQTGTSSGDALILSRAVAGRPRLHAGPGTEVETLPDGTEVAFTEVCPGTFTMGATGWLERTVDATVAAMPCVGVAEPVATTPLDADTHGADCRAELRAALGRALGLEGFDIDDERWAATTDLQSVRTAYADWLIGRERPAHPVLLDGFEIARTETTRAAYRALGKSPLYDDAGDARLPANPRRWDDARDYCADLGGAGRQGRLPSEAQWEFAARAGSRSPWFWGDDLKRMGEFAWYTGNSANALKPVGELDPNALGLHDMLGNVWEWNRDCYTAAAYKDRAERLVLNPARTDGDCRQRVLRGGAFVVPRRLRSALRFWLEPVDRGERIGFRCVRSVSRSR